MILWVKAFHIIAVISWMAGLLYLPRLLIYHFEAKTGSTQSETFKIMERRLLKVIMTPAMILTWMFGIWLAYLGSAWSEGWFISKMFLVFLLSAFHGFEVRWVREFGEDQRPHTQKFYRLANEVPTLLMVGIVILVVVRPF